MDRQDITDLSSPDNSLATKARTALLSLALTPAEATSDWAAAFAQFKDDYSVEDALRGLSYAKATTSEEEADFIALALREVLEEEGRTAYLVTADRLLARRVASRLAGWGIEIDDSGGTPLRGSYRATFMRLAAKIMAQPHDAASLAGLIGHQLFGLGLAPDERRPLVQAFDLFLRGRKPRSGWDGLEQSLRDHWRPYGPARPSGAVLAERAEKLLDLLSAAFDTPTDGQRYPVAELLKRHLIISKALASTETESGEERLFRFEDGEALEAHLTELLPKEELLGACDLASYPEVFDALLDGIAIRPPGGQHPRLSIFGLLEARLQTADLVVIGGLQEGIWPVEAPVDPFLSRGMRKHLGLPQPELDIGRVAHDFLDFASQPNLLLTRSTRQGRSPARASRLMVRLESFLDELDKGRKHDAQPRLSALLSHRYGWKGRVEPAPRPAPKPPAEHLPTSMSISTVSTWLRDPYEVFATQILRISPLDSYAASFSDGERGSMLHKLLELFVERHKGCSDDEIVPTLQRLLPEVQAEFDMPEVERHLNAKFLEQALSNFETFEKEARTRSQPSAVEAKGEWTISLGARQIKISGRADRIDQFQDGSVHVVDYKKGGTASMDEQANYSPQLFLTALMLRDGAFAEVGSAEASQVSFVRLAGADGQSSFIPKPGRTTTKRWLAGSELSEELAAFEQRFKAWLEDVYSGHAAFVSQIHPYRDNSDGPFDWLARRGEWVKGQSDE
jgi:ATP-dependent helicase/nuclease subunit B